MAGDEPTTEFAMNKFVHGLMNLAQTLVGGGIAPVPASGQSARRPRRARLSLEALEQREVLSAIHPGGGSYNPDRGGVAHDRGCRAVSVLRGGNIPTDSSSLADDRGGRAGSVLKVVNSENLGRAARVLFRGPGGHRFGTAVFG